MNDQSNSPVAPQDAATSTIALMQSMLARRLYIENALAYTEGTHTFDDLVVMVLQGRLLWWPLPSSFMLTEIVTYPQTKHLNVFLAGGELNEIRATQDQLIMLARMQGCQALSLSGRRGWVKALEKQGWKESHTAMLLPIEDEANG